MTYKSDAWCDVKKTLCLAHAKATLAHNYLGGLWSSTLVEVTVAVGGIGGGTLDNAASAGHLRYRWTRSVVLLSLFSSSSSTSRST